MNPNMVGMLIVVGMIAAGGFLLARMVDGPQAAYRPSDPEDEGQRTHALVILLGSSAIVLVTILGVLFPDQTSLPKAAWVVLTVAASLGVIFGVVRLTIKPKYLGEGDTQDNVVQLKR